MSKLLPEPENEPLLGSVKFYQRHLWLCTGAAGWPAKIEIGGGIAQTLAEMIEARKPEMLLKVKLTACDAPRSHGDVDIFVFPDRIRYLGLRESDLPALVEDHLVGNRICDRLAHEPLPGQHIFVCAHEARDERCGLCGPPLLARFRAEIAERGLGDEVFVHQASHVGGHHFAGNILIYPSGDWYGLVTPADVPRLIETCILRSDILTDRWRGRMARSR